VKKLLEVLAKSVPEHTVEAFDDVAAGTAQKEIAADRGVPYKKVRGDLEDGRKRFRNAVVLSGMGALLVAGAAWLLYARGSVTPNQEAHPTPSAPPSQVLVREDPALTQKKARAAELRQHAADLCAEQKWQQCSDALDLAYSLDQDGETTPGTKTLRDQADQGMMAKPIPGGKPPMPKQK